MDRSGYRRIRLQIASDTLLKAMLVSLVIAALADSALAAAKPPHVPPVSTSPPAPAKPAAPSPVIDLAALRSTTPPPGAIWVDSLDLGYMTQGWGKPQVGKSVEERPITLHKMAFPHGIGTHSRSQMSIDLGGSAAQFVTAVGIDDEVGDRGEAVFTVSVDGRKAAESPVMHGGDDPVILSVNLTRARRLVLTVDGVNDNMSNSHADWAGSVIVLAKAAKTLPRSVPITTDALTPAAFPTLMAPDPHPAIHGAGIVGCSPRRPFLFLIAATGKGPLVYSARGLPAGLSLDHHSGVISGQVAGAGVFPAVVAVSGPAGKAVRALTIVCGDHKLALTPPMGWNCWNSLGEKVTAEKVREQADALISTGLAARGFQYVIVDDAWQGRRDDSGALDSSHRFGDIKALADSLHAQGLKFGIESSPNEQTCSGFAGSAGHEDQDAAAYAAWGVDYLKYDWCEAAASADNSREEDLKAAYGKMRSALDRVNRDIVFHINTYGFGNPWEWAPAIANSWTSNADILDLWDMIVRNGFRHADPTNVSGPGHWSDPGWLMIGRLGTINAHFSHLKPGQQMSQLSLWSLLSAPLIITCDLTQMNPNNFYPLVTGVLTNDEVLDIDQDPLGKPAAQIKDSNEMEVWLKTLADGTKVVGIFNKVDWGRQEYVLRPGDLGFKGPQPVRDLWQHKDLGDVDDQVRVAVPPQGVVLLRIGAPTDGLAPAPTRVAGSQPGV